MNARLYLGVLLLLSACTEREAVPTDLCERFYAPYPDHVSDRQRTPRNEVLLDAMAAYNAQEHERAVELFHDHLRVHPEEKVTHMYLASSYLAMGKPYDAELQLDHLERTKKDVFVDPIDWYNALCWLCSGQEDRALKEAVRIKEKSGHGYKAQATELVEAMGGQQR